MLRNILSAFATGLVVFVFLLIWDMTQFTTPFQAYLFAGIAGALGALFWPLIMGFFLVRRAKSRRDDKIQQEVDRQLAEKQKQG